MKSDIHTSKSAEGVNLRQLRLTGLLLIVQTVSLLVLTAAGILVIPGTVQAIGHINRLLEETERFSENLDGIGETTDTLVSLTAELKGLDISATAQNIRRLADSTERTLAAARVKLEEMDIESLNNAISSLEAVVSPIARLLESRPNEE